MSEQVPQAVVLRCPGCQAQFRLTPRGKGVALSSVPCPGCQTSIPVASASSPLPSSSNEERGWARISHDTVFNRSQRVVPEVASPAQAAAPLQDRFRPVAAAEDAALSPAIKNLGVFGPRATARLPETDKPDDVRPLATALLKQLQTKRPRGPAPDALPLPAPISFDVDEVLDDLVEGVIDVLEPADSGRLPAPAAARKKVATPVPVDAAEEATRETVISLPPPLPPAAIAPAPVVAPLPTSPAASETVARAGKYRIRAGEVIYDSIDYAGLVALFRAGIWVVADEIAEADGPWTPIDEHPIFERVRHAIAASLVDVLSKVAIPAPAEAPSARSVPKQRRARVSTPVRAHGVKAPAPKAAAIASAPEPVAPATVVPADAPTRASTARVLVVVGLLVALAALSALAVRAHLAAERAVALLESDRPVAVVEPLANEPPPASMAELRAVWSAIAVASEAVSASTRVSPMQIAQGLVDQGSARRAREIVIEEFGRSGPSADKQAIFDQSLRADPALRYQVVTLGVDEMVDELRALGGGRSISLRLTRGGQNVYAFKPAQRDWEDWWRAEIAAYYLCEIMVCHFKVPQNRPARISRADFDALYARVDTDNQRRYAERFGDLIWVREPGPDGVVADYLYGTLKEWVVRYVHWPIEYHEIWQPWLDVDADKTLLEQPLEQSIRALRIYRNGQLYNGIMRERAEADTASMARQISSLLVFDYLTNNHDRFSLVEDFYGVNNHFANGEFVSIDNGAGFQFQPMQRVQTRFEWVTRFSASTLSSLELMRRPLVDAILFPQASANEKVRLDVFWQQRQRLLERVTSLSSRHGEDKVVAFD
ncbi:MAG: hypothetical protein H0U74_22920 [Bradymonadaceae bacterium]|nr:hypothetical protein [Lujinxingiaceae bacterium]